MGKKKDKSRKRPAPPLRIDEEIIDEVIENGDKSKMETELISESESEIPRPISDDRSTKIEDLERQVTELKAQLAKEQNEQLYIRAEFDTFRRRAIKERSELLKFGGERTWISMLSILDNFERALETPIDAENFSQFREGIKLIFDEFNATLKREGVEVISPVNDQFDPNIFEAISSEETNQKNPGQITRVFRKAYKLYDRVIRPGQVVVAKPLADRPNEPSGDEDGSNQQ